MWYTFLFYRWLRPGSAALSLFLPAHRRSPGSKTSSVASSSYLLLLLLLVKDVQHINALCEGMARTYSRKIYHG